MTASQVLTLTLLTVVVAGNACARDLWTPTQANAWYDQQPWLVGANYLPRTAINELEMWQADSFDAKTIDEEFGWAERIGFNSMRVFLHNLVWEQDSKGFIARIDQVLAIAERHHIRLMLVMFDSCWDPLPKLGKQHEPKPFTHNSGWVQAPGAEILKDPASWDARLKEYVTGVIGHFRTDPRIVLWDLYNELDNGFAPAPYRAAELPDKKELSLRLAVRAKEWALSADPSQPVSFGIWDNCTAPLDKMTPAQRFELQESDVITFHGYANLDRAREIVTALRAYGRPLLCTEYMARTIGSTFAAELPLFKQERIAAYNWGFVDGKEQTKFPLDSWGKRYDADPKPWFHDVLHADGTPYDPSETALITTLTGAK